VALVGLEPDELAAQAAACGPSAGWWVADVTDQAQIRDVAGQVRARFGAIDVVVANAGVASGGVLLQADETAYDRVIEVNLLGSIRTVRAVLPHLVESRGYYLQIASVAAIVPAAVMSAYCASKSGVEAFANVVKAEVRHHGVDVGVAYLSWIDTDMVRGADQQAALQAARSSMPWPLNLTFPVAPAIAALTGAIEGRKSRVLYPGWLWALYVNRPVSVAVSIVLGRRFARISERAAAANPGADNGLVGAGGAADARARQQALRPPGSSTG